MLVRMNSIYCTASAFCDPGKVINLQDAEAQAIIGGGYGAAVEKGAKVKIGSEPRNVKGDDK